MEKKIAALIIMQILAKINLHWHYFQDRFPRTEVSILVSWKDKQSWKKMTIKLTSKLTFEPLDLGRTENLTGSAACQYGQIFKISRSTHFSTIVLCSISSADCSTSWRPRSQFLLTSGQKSPLVETKSWKRNYSTQRYHFGKNTSKSY